MSSTAYRYRRVPMSRRAWRADVSSREQLHDWRRNRVERPAKFFWEDAR